MAAWHDLFDIVVTHPKLCSGPRFYVRVRNWIRPLEFADKPGMVCLSADAITADEFDFEVDEIIDQLQDLKKRARRKFARIERTRQKEARHDGITGLEGRKRVRLPHSLGSKDASA